MGLRPLGIDHFSGDEFRGGLDQGSLLLRRQRQQVGSGQCPRRFDADGSNRVAEERSQCFASADGGESEAGRAARRTGRAGSGSAIAALIAGSEAGVI